MREPFAITTKWVLGGGSALETPPPLVQAAYRQIDRQDRANEGHYIDWPQHEIEPLLQLIDQQRLPMTEDDKHENVRRAVARYLESKVIPECADPQIWKLPARLRAARQTGTIMYNPSLQKFITLWDDKAGLPLLDPDDAREEGMRLQRRYVPTLAAWRNNGKALHKLVLTLPNFAPGKLREGMVAMFKRFKRVVLKSGRFPEIKGALATLESPLSAHDDWNVHLNVIVMCDGFLDYGQLRALWHWQLDAYRIRGSTLADIEAALREIIKYPVRAIAEKSSHVKAVFPAGRARGADPSPDGRSPLPREADGSCIEQEGRQAADSDGAGASGGTAPVQGSSAGVAPALTEYPAPRFIELWDAYQHFRRTRTYGLLFKIKAPEPETLDGYGAVGFTQRDAHGRQIRRFPLLDSIPGDKSSGEGALDRYRKAIQRLHGPPDVARDALQLAQQAIAAWEQIKDRLQ